MAANANYRYFLTYFCAILFENLIIGEVTQLNDAINSWTDWTLCTSRPSCHRFRELTCGNQLGFECIASRDSLSEVFEQQLNTGCNLSNNADDITTNCSLNPPNKLPCLGHCYDAIEEVQYNCSVARGPRCILSNYRRCYNPNNCSETWSNWAPLGDCSVSCGGGTLSETRSCYEKNGTVSYNCPGTNVLNTAQTRSSIICNTQACPSWSEWVAVPNENCSATCGEGVQRFVSACREGTQGNLSTLCNGSDSSGRRFEYRPCIDLLPCPATSMATLMLSTTAIATTDHDEDDGQDLAQGNFLVIPIAIAATAAVLIVLLIIILVVCMRKKKRKLSRFSHTSSRLNSPFANQANESQHNEKVMVENAIYSQSEGVRFDTPTEVKNGGPGDEVFSMVSDDAQEVKNNEIYIPLEKQMQLETQNQPADPQLYDRVQNGRNVHNSAYDSFSR